MPDAVLNDEVLGDALVGAVDDIRREVHGALGTRPHRVSIVTRTWSGVRRGEGSPTATVLELDPPPKVTFLGLRNELRPGGREEEGDVLLTEVSLRYTEAELQPSTAKNVEWAYRIEDAHGQGVAPRYFTPIRPPIARRGDHRGDGTDWAITLKRVTDFGEHDNA